jgi:hypothetical protein
MNNNAGWLVGIFIVCLPRLYRACALRNVSFIDQIGNPGFPVAMFSPVVWRLSEPLRGMSRVWFRPLR